MICFIMLKRKICKEQEKTKKQKNKNKNAFKYGYRHVSRRCVSYKMYLKGDSTLQMVMILSECS